MNDIDFYLLVENIRKLCLLLLNSSLFWVFTAVYFISGIIKTITNAYDVSCGTKSKKSWCYDE